MFPKVEDNADLMLSYPKAVGIFEGSWDLPRGFQDLEIYGLQGSIYMKSGSAELRTGRGTEPLELPALPAERAKPISCMVSALESKRPIEGLTALEINVGVVEIIEAAKMSVKTGKAIPLPLNA